MCAVMRERGAARRFIHEEPRTAGKSRKRFVLAQKLKRPGSPGHRNHNNKLEQFSLLS